MKTLLVVGSGGFIGAVARYVIATWVHKLLPMAHFPIGTLAVNTAGCFLIGLMGGLTESRQLFNQDVRLFVFIGILGGFTTFSTFAHETMVMSRDGRVLHAMVNIGAQVICSLIAAWAGYTIAR